MISEKWLAQTYSVRKSQWVGNDKKQFRCQIMFQTEGEEPGWPLAQHPELGSQRWESISERCHTGHLETYLLSPSVSSKQTLKLLWISQGGKEPASVIRGERGGGREQWRKTPGRTSFCTSRNTSPLALLKATPRLLGRWGSWWEMNEMTLWEDFPGSHWLGFKSHFGNCSGLSNVSVRSIGYCGICPDCWPIKM